MGPLPLRGKNQALAGKEPAKGVTIKQIAQQIFRFPWHPATPCGPGNVRLGLGPGSPFGSSPLVGCIFGWMDRRRKGAVYRGCLQKQFGTNKNINSAFGGHPAFRSMWQRLTLSMCVKRYWPGLARRDHSSMFWVCSVQSEKAAR